MDLQHSPGHLWGAVSAGIGRRNGVVEVADEFLQTAVVNHRSFEEGVSFHLADHPVLEKNGKFAE